MAEVNFAERVKNQRARGFAESVKDSPQIGGFGNQPVDFAKILKGEQFEPDVENLGEPGLESAGARFQMARGGNFKEKKEAFEEFFPDGDIAIREVDDEPTLLFRPSSDKPFRKVDAGLTERFEPINDIVEFVGEDLGAIIGEMVAAVGTRGGSLIGLGTKLFAGGTLGDLAQEASQSLEGKQREDFDRVLGRALMKGTISGVVGSGGEVVLRGAANLFRKAGVIGTKPGARKVIKSAERIGVGAPPLSALTDAPLVQRLGTLSRAVSPTIDRYVDNVRVASKEVLSKLRGREKASLRRDLKQLEKTTRNRLINRVKQTTGGGAKDIDIAKAVQEYDDVAQTQVNNAYSVARSVEEPKFDLSSLKNQAERIQKTTKAQGVDIDPELDSLLKNIQNFDGSPKVVELSNGESVTVSATEQLNAFSEQLFQLGQVGSDQIGRRNQKLARQVQRVVRSTLDGPKNANQRFVRLWNDARQKARNRFETLEKSIVVQARKTEEPEQFLDRLINSEKFRSVEALRKAGVKTTQLKDAFVKRYLREPERITDELKKFDNRFKRLFVTEAEERSLREYGKQIDRLNKLDIEGVLAKQREVGKVIDDLMNKGTESVAALREMVDEAGGRASPVGKTIRSAVIDRVYRNAVVQKEGVVRVNANILKQEIKRLRETGAFRLLTINDMKILQSIENIEDFFGPLTDFGASLAGQETVAGIRGAATGDVGAARVAIGNLIESIGAGRFLISPNARLFLVGKGRQKLSRSGALGTTVAILSNTLTDNTSNVEQTVDNIMETVRGEQ